MTKKRPYIGPSEAQANAERLAMRGSPYAEPHEASVRRRNVRVLPRGLDDLLKWFIRPYQMEYADQLHTGGIETEKPGTIDRGEPFDYAKEKDPGGGNALGAPRWHDEARQSIFGKPDRLDEDGSYSYPLHWTVDFMARGPHPLKAAVLRLIGRGGDWRSGVKVTCGSCTSAVTLPEEYAEAIARAALSVAFIQYQEAPERDYRAA